jgi:UDP-N-acetylmuramate--alanine ligase
VLLALGFEPQASLDAISTFEGTERRFERRGEVGGVTVYDDFAHHPTEIRAALSGARGVVGDGRLIPIFQPHLYSRTRDMADEFAETFESLADYTIVVPIYGARQEPEPGVTGELITERFRDQSAARYFTEWQDAVDHAAEIARDGDFVIPMGGGDIYQIIPQLLAALEKRSARPRRGTAHDPAPSE